MRSSAFYVNIARASYFQDFRFGFIGTKDEKYNTSQQGKAGQAMREKYRKFSKMLPLIIYFVIWILTVAAFWLGLSQAAMFYSIAVFYLALPVSTFVLSIFIGRHKSWGYFKCLTLIFFGFLYMLAPYVTFSLANMLYTGRFITPDPVNMIPGILCSAAGTALGIIIQTITVRFRPSR